LEKVKGSRSILPPLGRAPHALEKGRHGLVGAADLDLAEVGGGAFAVFAAAAD